MRWLALACLLGGRTAHADDSVQPQPGAALHARIGTVTAPFYTEGLPYVRSEFQAYAIVGEAYCDLGPWRVGGRLPVTTSTIEQPAGSYTADYTIGNPELYSEHLVAVSGPPRDSGDGHAAGDLRLHLGIGLPLAGHGPGHSLVRNRVVAASDAVEGWRQPELYQVGVLPLVVGGRGQLQGARWRVTGELKLPVFVRTSSASLPADARTRPIGFIPVLTAGGSWRPLASLAVGATAAVTAGMPAPVVPTRDVGRSGALQTTFAPHLQLIGRRFSLEFDLLIAVAGPLDGSLGLGLHIGWHL